MRELSVEEVQVVSGGLSSQEAGTISATLAAGAAMAGSYALIPGFAPVAGAVSAVMGISAGVFGVYAAATSS